jgi:hypothetical protein
LFDRELLWPALIALFLAQVTLYICTIISAKHLITYGQSLIDMGQGKEVWLVRILVHNAWGIYASWVTIATLLNLGIVLTYVANMSVHIASSICLSILATELVVYFIVDNLFFERYLRYLITPYIVPHVALAGVLSANWDPLSSNSVFVMATLVWVVLLTCIKVVLMIWRHMNVPIFATEKLVKNQI